MATALSLITRAMRIARVIGKGETLDSDETTDGLVALNAMLDSWQTERLFVYQVRDETFTWAASQQTRTVGSGGNFATDRPYKVDPSSFFRSDDIDSGVEIYDSDEWARIVDKTTTSTIPFIIYPEYGTALVTLNAYPIPSASIEFHLRTWKLLQVFSTLTDALALPPGYQRAIEFSLAEEFGVEFEKDIPLKVQQIAAKARANVKRGNVIAPVMSSEVGFMGSRRAGNIFVGIP